MTWKEIRDRFPGQWLLVEAHEAHSENEERILDDLAVVSAFPSGGSAFDEYRKRHREEPAKELYVLHTDRESPEIRESRWLGLQLA